MVRAERESRSVRVVPLRLVGRGTPDGAVHELRRAAVEALEAKQDLLDADDEGLAEGRRGSGGQELAAGIWNSLQEGRGIAGRAAAQGNDARTREEAAAVLAVLEHIDAGTAEQPAIMGHFRLTGKRVLGMAIRDHHAYLAADDGLHIVDDSSPLTVVIDASAVALAHGSEGILDFPSIVGL